MKARGLRFDLHHRRSYSLTSPTTVLNKLERTKSTSSTSTHRGSRKNSLGVTQSFRLTKKGISKKLFFPYFFRIPHNLKTGLQLDVTR